MRKNEKVGKKFAFHNGAIKRLHIGAGFRDYRSEQERVQIGAGISNQSKEISNQGRDYK